MIIDREADIAAAIEAYSKKRPDGSDFAQSTTNYIQHGLDLAVHRIDLVLQRQFPAESLDLVRSLHAVRRTDDILPSNDLVEESPNKILLQAPSGKLVFANRVVESVYHANPALCVWDYAIPLYVSSARQKSNFVHYPGFNMRFTNVVTHGELPLTSPEAKIMAVSYITQVAKVKGVAAVREFMGKAKLYGGLASADYLEKQKDKLLYQVIDIKKHQGFIAEGLNTIDRVATQAGLGKPEVQLLLDLNFIKGRAFDTADEFQQALRPIVSLIAAGNWAEAFAHRDFLLNYFIRSFPQWRQTEYDGIIGAEPYGTMAEIVQAVIKGELEITEDKVPLGYKPLFGDRLTHKAVYIENKRYRDIVDQSLDISQEILFKLGDHRGDFIVLASPSGRSGRELSRVKLQNHKQVCEVYGRKTSNPVNFGAILYTRIKTGLAYDKLHQDCPPTVGRCKTVIRSAYNKVREDNPKLSFSMDDYVKALFHSGKGNLAEDDPVIAFVLEKGC